MKKFALFCAATAAALGMSAQDTPLTADMWHQWTGWGADATVIEDGEIECDYNIGKELGQSDMLIGPQSCNGDLYADLTEFGGIEGQATPGITLRLYLNRQDLQGPGLDIKVDTDADGKFSYLFSELGDVEFVHLNFIKIAAVWQGGKWPEGLDKCEVSEIGLIKKEDVPVVNPDALTVNWWHQWTGWGADATVIEDGETGCEYNIGKELGEGGMVIGQPSCNGDVYADLSEFAGIEGVATPGISIRFFFNRQELQGPGIDISVDTDAEGKYTLMFSQLGDVEFVHLNFIKILEQWRGGKWPAGLEKCVVESMNLIPKGSSEDPEPPVVDSNAITGAWFHQWDGFGADAQVITEVVSVDDQIGKTVNGGGAVILGTAGVAGDIYADLTQYAGIEAEGTPGVMLRLLFNRPTQSEGITECVATFDENGKFTFKFDEVKADGVPASFIHLNAVKTQWGVESCTVTKFNAIPLEGSSVNAIENADSNAVIYNIYGQRVDESYRGIVIKNGKKYIQK